MDDKKLTRSYKGRAIEDYVVGTPLLKIYVPELLPGAQDGSFAPGVSTVENSYSNIKSAKKISKVSTTNYIEATWMSEPDISSPPHVKKGEQVEVFYFAQSSNFYWRSLGRDISLRTTDRYCIRISAVESQASATKSNTDDNTTVRNDDNTYIIDVDPSNSKIRIKTSKANNETNAYSIEIDGKKASLSLSDDKGGPDTSKNNQIVIFSAKDQIQLSNNQASSVILAGKNIQLACDGNIALMAKQQIILQSPCTTFNPLEAANTLFYKEPTVVFNSSSLTFNIKKDLVMGGTGKVGVNMSSKFSKAIVTSNIRCSGLTTGILGSEYAPSKIDITTGTADVVSSAKDDDTSGLLKRTTVAYMAMNEVIVKLEEDLNKALLALGLTPSTAASLMPSTEIKDIKGS